MIEYGTEIKGEKQQIDKDSPMREEVTYELVYQVTAIPLPGFLEGLRALILSAFAKLIAQFKGLELLYWRLTEAEFLFQVRGRSSPADSAGPVPLGWQEVALAVVAIAAQGLLLILGIVMVLKAIFEIIKAIPPIPPIPQILRDYWAYFVVGGIGALALIFLWPRRKKA